MTVRAMKAGAMEFLTKPLDDDALVGAIRGAIERSQAALAKEADSRALQANFASLSRREHQVMALVVSGLLNKQVASQLGISEITLKAHHGRVMQKMKATSFADLVKMGEKLGLDPRQRGDRHDAEAPHEATPAARRGAFSRPVLLQLAHLVIETVRSRCRLGRREALHPVLGALEAQGASERPRLRGRGSAPRRSRTWMPLRSPGRPRRDC